MNQSVPIEPHPKQAVVPAAPAGGDISPAEAKFWQEWAEKAPNLIRGKIGGFLDKMNTNVVPYKVGSVALGAALGGATLTKYVPGQWKWASGIGAAASLAAAMLMESVQVASGRTKQAFLDYADALERDPALKQRLAGLLSSTVTAENIQSKGLEHAVVARAMEFGSHMGYIQADNALNNRAR